MLPNVDVELNCDFFEKYRDYEAVADRVIFTGMIDQFYDYCYGELEYRSLHFELAEIDTDNYQGVAVVNYTGVEVPYTRIIEHKHFEFGKQDKTVITIEHPCAWEKGKEAYYPINNVRNDNLYTKYAKLAAKERQVIFGGRLGTYKYYDMDQTIEAALKCVRNEMGRENDARY